MNIFSPFSNLTHKNSIFCVNFIFHFNPRCSKRMNFKQPESTAAFATEIPEKRKRKCKPKIDSFQKVCFGGCVAGRTVELCARHPGNPHTAKLGEQSRERGMVPACCGSPDTVLLALTPVIDSLQLPQQQRGARGLSGKTQSSLQQSASCEGRANKKQSKGKRMGQEPARCLLPVPPPC